MDIFEKCEFDVRPRADGLAEFRLLFVLGGDRVRNVRGHEACGAIVRWACRVVATHLRAAGNAQLADDVEDAVEKFDQQLMSQIRARN